MSARVAVFASGGGSNFQALLDAKQAGRLAADFALLVTNNSKAFAVERAKGENIPVLHLPPSRYFSEEEYTAALFTALDEAAVEWIVLAGYMKKLPAELIRRYHNRIVNIHPALLPAFGGRGMYGMFVHEAVLKYGAKISGITVHLVDEEYDHGAVILQDTVPVLDDDTPEELAKRVLALEHASFWRALQALFSGTVSIEGRRVVGSLPAKISR